MNYTLHLPGVEFSPDFLVKQWVDMMRRPISYRIFLTKYLISCKEIVFLYRHQRMS